MHRHRFSSLQRLSFLSALIVACSVVAFGQGGGVDTSGTGGRHSIIGRIVFPSGQRADVRLKVRLESSGAGDRTVLSDNNGSFGFQNLVPGNYTVVIEGGDYFESVREPVFIESAAVTARRIVGSVPIARPFSVHIYLRPKLDAAVKPGVLNAALATVPKPALEHYEKALEFVRQGDSEKAINELKKAIELHPNFGLALNELGVQYLKRGNLDLAAEALQKVIAISPDAVEPRLNYGVVLVNQRKFVEAEPLLREVIGKSASSFTGHMYLGISLIFVKKHDGVSVSYQNKYDEAETHLKKSIELGGPKAGLAYRYLGGLFWELGRNREAADALEQYLKLEPKAPNSERIRNTIKDLRAKSEH